jgi:hypothetical protein
MLDDLRAYQAGQQADDGEHHQQFDQGESGLCPGRGSQEVQRWLFHHISVDCQTVLWCWGKALVHAG